jgi:hypothetical protein
MFQSSKVKLGLKHPIWHPAFSVSLPYWHHVTVDYGQWHLTVWLIMSFGQVAMMWLLLIRRKVWAATIQSK